jgi:hypothetical protein
MNNCYSSKKEKKIKSSLDLRIRNSLIDALFNNKYHKKKLYLDYFNISEYQLKKHFELKFLKCMNWFNYGLWEIDHLTPKSWFYYQSLRDGEFYNCWHISNLTPKWKKDNFNKKNKYSDKNSIEVKK